MSNKRNSRLVVIVSCENPIFFLLYKGDTNEKVRFLATNKRPYSSGSSREGSPKPVSAVPPTIQDLETRLRKRVSVDSNIFMLEELMPCCLMNNSLIYVGDVCAC